MVRHGQNSEPLRVFLESFGIPKSEAQECDLCKHYSCWRSVNLTNKRLNDFPRQLRPQIYKRWFSVNGFRFLDLPPELREAILVLAIGPVAEPFAQSRYVTTRLHSRLSTPNMALALVSRQVYNEVMPLLFANAVVYIRRREQFIRFFRFAYPTQRPRFSENLRILSLDMVPGTLLKLFGVKMLHESARYYYVEKQSQANDTLLSVCLNWDALKVLRIHLPHIHRDRISPHTICQKAFSTVVWSAAREYIRNIPCVEFKGYVCEPQKQNWLEVLASDRKEVKTGTAGDLLDWKRQIWDDWYVEQDEAQKPS